MQKWGLFAPLSFLLKVQFVRQLASFSKDAVCNLLVAAIPAFIQQESAAVRTTSVAFLAIRRIYQVNVTYFKEK